MLCLTKLFKHHSEVKLFLYAPELTSTFTSNYSMHEEMCPHICLQESMLSLLFHRYHRSSTCNWRKRKLFVKCQRQYTSSRSTVMFPLFYFSADTNYPIPALHSFLGIMHYLTVVWDWICLQCNDEEHFSLCTFGPYLHFLQWILYSD